ncbi:MAG: restriction endonuclease subunit S, partial [Parcubacteria group bacterium]|nr:restriction endonuclease subunit S [Parcubacteria group bacterium]
ASVKEYRVNEIKKFLGKNAPNRARREIIENDIIISTVRPNLRGFTFITDLFNHFLCSTGFCVLRCEAEVCSKYLYYIILQDKFVRYLVDKTTGSNYPAVNSNIIGEYIFKLPSIKVQKQIAEILSAVDDKIDINKLIKNKLTQLKKGLMRDLLSGRVRVT